jgi:hypothetical protein
MLQNAERRHYTSHHITSENLKASLKPPPFSLNEAFFISKFEARSSDHLCRLARCAAQRFSRRRKAILAARRFRYKPLFWDSAVGNTTSCYFRPSRNVCVSVSVNKFLSRRTNVQGNVEDVPKKVYIMLNSSCEEVL